MIEIIQSLDAWTEEHLNYSPTNQIKLFGYCEQMRKTEGGVEQHMPVQVVEGNSDRPEFACLDDIFQVVTWFRLPGKVEFQDEIDGNDWAFGLSEGDVNRASLLWVIAARVELGERWIFDFIKAIPKKLTIEGYQVVHIDKKGMVLDADHEAIYNSELGRTVYEKHRFTWNIYAISPLPVEYILCPTANIDCCVDSYLAEDGDCLIQE
jgi:hypothetical protein